MNKKPGTIAENGQHDSVKTSFFEDGDVKIDEMEEFEDVVCEELVDSCLEQMRKHSARYSQLDSITEVSQESGETTRKDRQLPDIAPPSLLI